MLITYLTLKLAFSPLPRYSVSEREESMKPVMVGIWLPVLIIGCAGEPEKPAAKFDREKTIAACERLITDFQSALKRDLFSALAEGGPESAISVCRVKAPAIADSFSQMAGLEIRRVSLRQRNPQYAPDSFEIAVLEQFAATGSAEPQTYSAVTFDSADVRRFRYIREIKVDRLCLNCHGDPGTFSEPLAAALARDYPRDRAVGYAIGESRGGFSITVTYPDAEESVAALVNGL